IPRADLRREREAAGHNLGGDWEIAEQAGTPYGMARRLLRAPGGWPCTPPPWGTLNGIDADSGAVKWTVPLGQLPALGAAGPAPPEFGTVSLGGPIVTAGGLVFIGGTIDRGFRAFDVETGKELWKAELPTSARSMPMTYRGPDGRQYVVITAGGHGLPIAPLGDSVIAFALPP
ncbi:MAG TPA: PQQ-binding-like beta-propeller repeat protein, partial [Thermoanaerobaculia bacterium]|nr:PQQ-binding-like beta-propeller repeat protein [Thermoanaerobaculia bacterium]